MLSLPYYCKNFEGYCPMLLMVIFKMLFLLWYCIYMTMIVSVCLSLELVNCTTRDGNMR